MLVLSAPSSLPEYFLTIERFSCWFEVDDASILAIAVERLRLLFYFDRSVNSQLTF